MTQIPDGMGARAVIQYHTTIDDVQPYYHSTRVMVVSRWQLHVQENGTGYAQLFIFQRHLTTTMQH
jgi:hypothetical protein